MNRILVAIKRVVDYHVRVRIKPDGSGIVTDGVKHGINPFDEIALEEALRIRERGQADEVIVATIGGTECQQQLRTALALGADRALHVVTADALEPLYVAKLLRAIVEREAPMLAILGKQGIDDDHGQTGQMLAALWQRPQATYGSKLELTAGSARVTREIDSGLETIEVDLPAVVTTDLRLNVPRYAKLPEILKAKSKPLATLTPAELGVSASTRIRTLGVQAPPQRHKGIKVANAVELVGALKTRGLL